MLVGDVELDNLIATHGTTILFVVFTMFGVIVLLNVLIAIIADSYEKATLRGQVLFGRARIMFVAQNEALENFLKPRRRRRLRPKTDLSGNQLRWNRITHLGRWLVLIAILTTALFTEAWIVSAAFSLGGSSQAKDIAYFVVRKFEKLSRYREI